MFALAECKKVYVSPIPATCIGPSGWQPCLKHIDCSPFTTWCQVHLWCDRAHFHLPHHSYRCEQVTSQDTPLHTSCCWLSVKYISIIRFNKSDSLLVVLYQSWDILGNVKPGQVPLDSIPSLQHVNCATQLGVICELSESALDPTVHVAYRDVK